MPCRVSPQHFRTLHQWCIKFLSTIFYPFWGRKYRIGNFGCTAAQTGKKFWKETLRTTGAKFRMKILSPGQFFWILLIRSHPVRKYQIGILGHRAAKIGKNPGEKLLAPLVQSSEWKYSLQVNFFEFYPSGTNSSVHSAECRQLYTTGTWSFSARFFTCFGRPRAKNFDSVLSTGVRPVSYFWPGCDLMPHVVLLTVVRLFHNETKKF